MIELRPTAPSRLRLWVDGTLKGEVVAPECGALPGGRWAPAGAGRWLQGHGDAVPAGEPGGDWPGGALGDLGISAGDVTRHAPEEPWIYRYKDLRSWWSHRHHERIGGVWHEAPTAWVPQSKPIWFTEYGCAAIDKGTNQPNKFLDPKSSESALPRYSTGRRDDLMQMQYLRAMAAFWGRDENNPVSELYGAPMVAMERAHVWAWDARPYPYFPGNSELWSDAANYTRGHWITGRATARPMASVVEEIAAAAGVDAVDTSRLWGLVRGYALSEIGTARAALQPLMLAGGVDAVEREGKLVFRSRDGRAVATLDPARVAVHDEVPGDIEAIRQPEAEVAGRVRLSHLAADGDYEAAVAEAVFPGAPEAAVSQSDLSVALTGAEARAVAERWMAEARVARDRLRLALPPSQGALGAGDVIRLRDGRYRIDRVEEAGSRLIEAVRVEPGLYAASDAAAEAPRRMRHVAPVPVVPLFLDLPLLTGAEVPHAPHVAATADPWPGEVAVYGAAEDAGYRLDARLPVPAVTGLTLSPLLHAASGRFDRGAPLRLRLSGGALSSVGMAGLLSGANAMAISDGAGGDWEVFQFAEARLVAPGVYEVSRRLRGQLGTDAVMPQVWPEGSRVVLLDRALMQLPLRPDDRDVLRHYRVGPAGKGYDDPLYRHVTAAFAGVGLRPYAPVHLRASPAPGGAIETSWIRRTRIDGDSWAGFDVPLGEDREAYLVRVEAGGTVLRETVVTMPAWTYEADARDEDAGAGVATLAVAQISDRYGPGPFARRPLCGGAVQR
ncbi:hypothetical protein EKE94_09025 [Mesobaculum littorinae]|uniref:Phage tail protein n=2 Tax=Mesobaculum littorinae TaxID=2486419 RepID=A0A438AKE9_9RHOB|nr:hypothetical protein EKE94_09025 [Mesobaculum littorinae]